MVVLGLIAFLAAAILPLASAFFCWAAAERLRRAWIVHLLFAPVLLLIEMILLRSMFWCFADDGDGSENLGVFILPVILSFILAIGGYYAVLIRRAIVRRSSS